MLEKKLNLAAIFEISFGLTRETPKLPSYRNPSIDLQSKSIDCFLYDDSFGV